MEVLFHSVYQEEEPLLSSGQQQLCIPRQPLIGSRVSQPVRGLICLQLNTKFVICNPGTKMFRNLPEIQANESMGPEVYRLRNIRFARWDPVEKLRDGSNASVIINHILKDYLKEGAIKLPKQINFTRRGWDVVNYNGKIAVSIMVDEDTGLLRIWARNEIGVWLKEDIVVSRWKETTENRRWFRFKGTIGTKELVFAPDSFVDEAPSVLYYNTETQKLRRFKIEQMFNGPPLIGSDYVSTFLDHVDSTWLM
ncbi:PREDICTED: putative F-box protein At1g70390 [Camelina sativa]|uniref:F-box protein At1g70390 n=1 Tax=Camelina sativa TaxID=90675 RepID=A0ABM0T0R5_CAMSA|nr:PREDICTED: putative F-box protein At1g70390 [Camelina sativa]